jgi:hypothetical protein
VVDPHLLLLAVASAASDGLGHGGIVLVLALDKEW